MASDRILLKTEFCNACLNCECRLHKMTIKNEKLRNILQTAELTVCHICRSMVQHFELFAHNVESVQNYFTIELSTLNELKSQAKPLHNLQLQHLNIIELPADPEELTTEEVFTEYSSKVKKNYDVEIKAEVKLEGVLPDDDDYADMDDDDIPKTPFDIKEEANDEDQDLKELIKLELPVLDGVNLNGLKRKSLKRKIKSNKLSKYWSRHPKDIDKLEIVHISKEECIRERLSMAADQKYLRSPLKCEYCIKGFTFKSKYDEHMEQHKESTGDFVCDICSLRKDSKDKLIYHQKYHKIRYKCKACDLMRVCRKTILDHYSVFHAAQNQLYSCPQCPKTYRRLVSLKKHVNYAHSNKQRRVVCDYCKKTYANKDVLKGHMVLRHPSEMAVEIPKKCCPCQLCGKTFRAPSLLKKHMLKHTDKKDYYCVECDKSFKSDTSLQHHLKTATPHANYMDLRYPCLQCDKRFPIKRDLERHMNSIHLNVRPYQCDKCERAYVSKWSLSEHVSLIHDGLKRPLKFPCPMCDKIFNRNQILKSHIRTHTGERPYQCSKCPSNFSQASILRTHMKLIHLKLTRDGRAKTTR